MHNVVKSLGLVVFGLGSLLAGCSSEVPQTFPAPRRAAAFSQVVSLQVGPDAERRTVEAEHGGKVLAWYPEAGLAILGLYGGELSPLSVKDAFKTPEVSTLSAYNNGFRAWSGGARAWGGGNAAKPTTFVENTGLWNLIRLVPGQNLAPNLGAGVKVAVIDSGLDLTHPAFSGRLAPASEWRDFVDDDGVPQEVAGGRGYGHGTAVAGVVLQVAPNATILPLRVLEPDGTGDLDKVILAVDWAVQRGAKIINLSLGTDADHRAFKDIVELASSKGVAVVASSGNNGTKGLEYPARYHAQVVAVGSVAATGVQSIFSSFGKELDVMAPGEYVYSAAPAGGVAYSSGTSFAGPMLSGAYALALGQKPVSLQNLGRSYEDTSVRVGANAKGTLQVDAFLKKALSY